MGEWLWVNTIKVVDIIVYGLYVFAFAGQHLVDHGAQFVVLLWSDFRERKAAEVAFQYLDVAKTPGVVETEKFRVEEGHHGLDAHAFNIGDEDVGAVEEEALCVVVGKAEVVGDELIDEFFLGAI